MIKLKPQADIDLLKVAGRHLAEILMAASEACVPGVTTQELEDLVVALMKEKNVRPLFKGHQGYPAVSCISVNQEIVHGIPSADKEVKEGDIVGIDAGLWHEHVCVDAAVTVAVGKIDTDSQKLLAVTKEALARGITQAVPGNHIGDIGKAIGSYIEEQGLAVIQGLVGHGVGYDLWEPPQVPNIGSKGTGPKLQPGLVIAIEPMVSLGSPRIKTLSDGWTIETADGARAAQFEHTVAITEHGPQILTTT